MHAFRVQLSKTYIPLVWAFLFQYMFLHKNPIISSSFLLEKAPSKFELKKIIQQLFIFVRFTYLYCVVINCHHTYILTLCIYIYVPFHYM